MRYPSAIREKNRSGFAWVVIFTGTLALSGCGGTGSDTCISPRAVSDVYKGDPTADPSDQETWQNGVRISTDVPDGANGIVVGYRPPNGDWAPLRDSAVISPDRATEVGVLIGHDAVVFSTQIVADAGSTLCETTPDTTFGQREPQEDLRQADVLFPSW
jgi:hypothetical protein